MAIQSSWGWVLELLEGHKLRWLLDTFGMWELFLVLLPLKQIRFFWGCLHSDWGPVLSWHCVWGRGKSSFHCFYFFAMRFSAFKAFQATNREREISISGEMCKPRCTLVNFFESSFSEFSVLTVHDGYLNTQSEWSLPFFERAVWLISRWCVHQPWLRLLVLCPLFQTCSARVATMSLLLMASLVITVRRQPWRANGSNFMEACHYWRILIDFLHSCFISERLYIYIYTCMSVLNQDALFCKATAPRIVSCIYLAFWLKVHRSRWYFCLGQRICIRP